LTEWNTEKFVKKLRGENDIEATIQRLDRLTLDEGRATAAQTLEVIYGLIRHRRAIMDGKKTLPVPFLLCSLLNFMSSDTDGSELAATISHTLGMFQVRW
jgi:hypothetical protein